MDGRYSLVDVESEPGLERLNNLARFWGKARATGS